MKVTRNFSPLSINIETEEDLYTFRRLLVKFDNYDKREHTRFMCYSSDNPQNKEMVLARKLLEELK